MEKVPELKYSTEKLESLREKLIDFSDRDPVEYFRLYTEVFPEMEKDLRTKYGEPRNYAFFHVLIGSSGLDQMTNIEHEDFPGNDSVELFIDNLMNQK